jgi:cytochrome b6-f complex iron-sulfur subunit
MAELVRGTVSEDISRRSFLARLWKAGLGLLGVAAVWTSWDVLQPPAVAGSLGSIPTVPAGAVQGTAVVEVESVRGYLTKAGDEVIALSWKCPHLGCRVPWCDSSAEFECPCHGSIFNRVGEYREGPATHGMDRYPTTVDENGVVLVDTSIVIQGPPAGRESIDEPPAGPRCIGGDA